MQTLQPRVFKLLPPRFLIIYATVGTRGFILHNAGLYFAQREAVFSEPRHILFPSAKPSASVLPEGQVSGTSALESEIDRLVYQFYGLTYDEVLIIDPKTPLTREKYEKEANS